MQKKHIQFLGHITNIHQVLAHSYLVYFAAAIFGFIVDYFYPFRIFGGTVIAFGPVLLIAGTALIYWAQHTSEMTAKNRKEHGIGMTPADFMHGPYKYTRSPTHIGLVFLVLGFGFIMNSGLIAIGAIVAYVVTRYAYIRREEEILVERYGEAYVNYKKIVTF